MEIKVFDTPDQLATSAASFICSNLSKSLHPLLCAASGDTPSKTYAELILQLKANPLNSSSWSMLALDEWVGMNKSDEGSCGFSIINQLIDPLAWTSSQTCFFDGRAADLYEECIRVEKYLQDRGPITVAILGLGLNGHIGLNEPGTDPSLRSHISSLEPITAQTGQKYFQESKPLQKGITLGLSNLLEADHLVLLVTGAHKRDIVQQLLHADPHPALPASILKQHKSFHLLLDAAAAGR